MLILKASQKMTWKEVVEKDFRSLYLNKEDSVVRNEGRRNDNQTVSVIEIDRFR